MKRSVYDWILELITIFCLIWSFYPFCFYDRLGDCSLFWLLSLFSLCFYIGISILERYYAKLNYPVKVTESNANSLYRLSLGLLRHVKFFAILLLSYINNATLSVSLSKGDGLNGYILTVLLAGLMVVVFVYIRRMMKCKD